MVSAPAEKLGVTVRLGAAATPGTIDREAPDAVVLATGASWQKNGFNGLDFRETPGWEQPHVLSLTDVVSEVVEVGKRVVIFDLKGFVERRVSPSCWPKAADRWRS